MHELSIATGIIEIVVEEAEKAAAGKVTRVEVEIGSIAGIEKEALLFSWDVVREGTIARQAPLVVRDVPAIAECLECHHQFHLEHPLAVCPDCLSVKYRIIQGKELRVSALEVE